MIRLEIEFIGEKQEETKFRILCEKSIDFTLKN